MSASEALERLDSEEVAVIITDQVMPGMSGPVVAAALRADQPRLKVLYVSGYAADEIRLQEREREGTAFLRKPFRKDDLARHVWEQGLAVEAGRAVLGWLAVVVEFDACGRPAAWRTLDRGESSRSWGSSTRAS